MIDKLIEFIINILDLFRFWEVVNQWESGVRLRLGRQVGGTLVPGFHYKWPFKIDEILTIGIVPEVAELDPQTVTTLDNVVITVQAVVKYKVSNPEKALLEVGDEVSAVRELTQGFIRTVLIKTNYDSINSLQVTEEIEVLSKKEATKWGVQLMKVTIKSLGRMTTIRLMQDTRI